MLASIVAAIGMVLGLVLDIITLPFRIVIALLSNSSSAGSAADRASRVKRHFTFGGEAGVSMQSYDPHVALIVVDMQNDFAHPGGSLFVPGGDAVITAVNREIELSRTADAAVVYTQDWHPPTTPHFAKDGGIWPVHCVQHTWGAEFVHGLIVHGPVVRKGTEGEDGYSGFTVRDPATGARHPTGLVDQLRGRDIERVVVVGLATDYCVKETALDAVSLGYSTTVLADAVRAVDRAPSDGHRALEELAGAGVRVNGVP